MNTNANTTIKMEGNTMNTKTTRITEELKWQPMKYRFYTLDELKEAIASGKIKAMLETCAKELHNDNLDIALAAMRENLSSMQTNIKKRTTVTAAQADDYARYQLLWEYVKGMSLENKPAVQGLPVSTKAKARWMLTDEEIAAIPDDDYKSLDSIYQNMMSAKSKYADKVEELYGMSTFLARLDRLSDRRTKAKAALKNKQITVSETVMSKLQKGTKTTLTAEEVQELLNAFKK